mmetsp:Transcript_69682/g.213655  ORF Transcript_69682/g.213655 Transcript_69682/m.213655 type:complete len:204 (-) Transcript_69682:177-788(-)
MPIAASAQNRRLRPRTHLGEAEFDELGLRYAVALLHDDVAVLEAAVHNRRAARVQVLQHVADPEEHPRPVQLGQTHVLRGQGRRPGEETVQRRGLNEFGDENDGHCLKVHAGAKELDDTRVPDLTQHAQLVQNHHLGSFRDAKHRFGVLHGHRRVLPPPRHHAPERATRDLLAQGCQIGAGDQTMFLHCQTHDGGTLQILVLC